MIYEFNIKVPLTYNKFAILSNNPDTEHCYGFKESCEESFNEVFTTYEIPGCENGYKFENEIKITLRKNILDNGENLELKEDPRLICEINGILVDDERSAKEFAEKIINRICKRLSLVFIKHNYNRHLSQPRVEPVWSEANYSHCQYAKFIEMKHKVMEELAEKDNTIWLDEGLSFGVKVHCITRTTIPCSEIKIGEWISDTDDVVDFLLDEYYSALGTENIKSKFFHLFAMIEFCEKTYENHNGSQRLLSDEEVNEIILRMKTQVDAKKRGNVVSILKSALVRANDTGRGGKLKNILKWMGIEKYKQCGIDKIINKEILDSLIDLRNKSFHGTKEKAGEAIKKYAKAVEVLLYINEMILEFAIKNESQEKTKSIYLIEGKK